MAAISSRLICAGCGWEAPPDDPAPFRCPRAGDDRDHILQRRLEADREGAEELRRSFDDRQPNPFLRFRSLLHSYRSAVAQGWSDAELVALIERLDAAVGAVDGAGFRVTPLVRSGELAAALGVADVRIKDETGNVSGSHKARHLFGLMLWLETRRGAATGAPLAIASCGNAALGAAVVARAAARPLEVFVPPWADPAVLARLRRLGSRLVTCPRRPGERGDPCFLRFREAVGSGALPFTCQGSENGLTLDGGRTLAWEMAASLAAEGVALDRLFVQVGGGALASACIQGLSEAHRLGVLGRLPRLHCVQTEGAYPLVRAWDRLVDRLVAGAGDGEDRPVRAARAAAAPRERITAVLADAAARRSAYMQPWDSEPASVASGILDDETYDWLALLEAMLDTGGHPIVVSERTLREAHRLGRAATGIAVDPTGTAGLAGALELAASGGLAPAETVAVLFTGRDRGPGDAATPARGSD